MFRAARLEGSDLVQIYSFFYSKVLTEDSNGCKYVDSFVLQIHATSKVYTIAKKFRFESII